MEWIDAFLASGVRVTTPILLATLACLPTIWTRDVNVGLEGIMIFGAFTGVAAGMLFQFALIALLCTVVLAGIAGVLFGVLMTKLRLDVFVGGIVLIIFAEAATVYTMDALYGVKGTISDPSIPALERVNFPFLTETPIVGPLLSGNSIITWLAVLLTVVVLIAERKLALTRYMRAAGSHPTALAVAGVNVTRVRIGAQVWCFILSAIAGVQISLGQLQVFTDGMVGGLGFVALSAALFSLGRAWLGITVAVGLGFALALTFQINDEVLPGELTRLIPYVLAFVGMIVFSRVAALAKRRENIQAAQALV